MNTHYHTRYHTQTIAHAHYHKQIIAHSLNFAQTHTLSNTNHSTLTQFCTHTQSTQLQGNTIAHTHTQSHAHTRTHNKQDNYLSSLQHQLVNRNNETKMGPFYVTLIVYIHGTDFCHLVFLALPTETCLRSFSEEEGSFFALKVDFEANQPQNKHLSLKTSHC